MTKPIYFLLASILLLVACNGNEQPRTPRENAKAIEVKAAFNAPGPLPFIPWADPAMYAGHPKEGC